MQLTIDRLLAQQVAERPEACFLRFRERQLSYAELDREATELAHALRGLGAERGKLLALFMHNSADFVVTWFGAARLGVPIAPVNTAFRGRGLTHVLQLTEADTLIADEDLCDSIEAIAAELSHIKRLIVRGDADAVAGRFPAWEVLPFSALRSGEQAALEPVNREGDLAMLLFTSGTTGRSKGCELSHRMVVRQGQLMVEHLGLREDDVLYCPFPLFHMDAAVLTVSPALVLGATAAIGPRFSASGFWDEVRAFGATVFDFMGATLTILHKREPLPDDLDNPVRLGWGVPIPEFGAAFEARFGLRLVELYGSTDAGIPIFHPLDQPRRAGACGRAIDCYDVRLFDDADREVAVGEVGEIVLRPREPSLIADGYFGMPEATRASRRNLWFHTGDIARQDADGYFYFVGRRSDAIRRRGENISAFEIEEVVDAHPQVLEVAAFGVPSELSEEDVMVAVVPRPGQALDPAELVTFCTGHMARHMVPRYVEIVDALPRTPTEKVEKYRLAERGVTATTWDRERPTAAAG